MCVRYTLTMSRRSYMPRALAAPTTLDAVRRIEQRVLDRRRRNTVTPVYVDAYTDQINVRVGRELIAIYMA
jgi:hypothetical protein